ncbi:MAG: hypothetical protein PUF72_09125 [Clostridiales bacterium]|nr:hypothetical protein [Clostridiales bacterium]
MNDENKAFTAYDYKEITADKKNVSQYIDCYECFGWQLDNKVSVLDGKNKVTLHLKRDRRLANKAELTRLTRHFEACMNEISELERSKTSAAVVGALNIGLIGTAFVAGSTFAVTSEPPIIWLCILLAIPGFIGWILPYFVYQKVFLRRTEKVTPLIEAKYDEIYEICEKGNKLL